MKKYLPFLLLLLRVFLFGVSQSIIALFFLIAGNSSPWQLSEGYWILSGLFTNLITFPILILLYKKEGLNYFSVFKFTKKEWWKDVLIAVGLLVLSIPLASLPNTFFANLFLGSPEVAFHLFFRHVPFWIIIIGFIWAITQGLVELPFYFSYIMPRIEKLIQNGWLSWVIVSIFLAFQHIAFPLIFDYNFILWRFGMFIPFALFAGLCIKLRPRLLPYYLIIHALMDIVVVAMLINVK